MSAQRLSNSIRLRTVKPNNARARADNPRSTDGRIGTARLLKDLEALHPDGCLSDLPTR